MTAIQRDLDKKVKTQHAKMVSLEKKVRTLKQSQQTKVAQTARVLDSSSSSATSEPDVEEVTKRARMLKLTQKSNLKKYEQAIRSADKGIEELDTDVNLMLIKLKEKEQECKICDMKIKELKRGMPHKSLRPIGIKYRNVKSKVKATTFYSSGVGSNNRYLRSTGMTTFTTSISHKNKAMLPSSIVGKGMSDYDLITVI